MIVKKLHPYFQAHIIVVLTNYSIITILHKLDTLGRLLKWAVKLSEFDIEYSPRSAIKGQILADFIVEILDVQPRDLCELSWLLETNGSSKAVREGASMILQSPKGLSIV